MAHDERRKHSRFPVIQNVGEPIELNALVNGKKVNVLGFIMNLSSGGMGIIALGDSPKELPVNTHFVLDLTLGGHTCKGVEGRIARVDQSRKAKLHHENSEWEIGMVFTKIKASDSNHLKKMSDDWADCETKIQINLPDVCFRECTYYDICEKPAKLPPEQHPKTKKHA